MIEASLTDFGVLTNFINGSGRIPLGKHEGFGCVQDFFLSSCDFHVMHIRPTSRFSQERILKIPVCSKHANLPLTVSAIMASEVIINLLQIGIPTRLELSF